MTDLTAPVRAAAFVAALAVVLVGALGVGRLVGPLDVQASTDQSDGALARRTRSRATGAATAWSCRSSGFAAGLQPLSFTIVGEDGPLTSYDERHERDLHLIVVRRDLTGFQHVHPTLDPGSGEWTADVALDPGSWRVIADFVPGGGEQLVLAGDLVVEGAATVPSIGEDVLGVSVDGYDVTLGINSQAGAETRAVVTVMKDGREVTDLGQYLGELGHLVVLRDGDLEYVHAHPVETPGTGPVVPFDVTFPTGGRYRLFVEFEHDGAVHTAVFTVGVEAGDGHTHDHGEESGEEPGEEDGHGH